jgi:hypothetical protein
MNRLITLDMLRGYALICIMVDHMPISVLRNFTLGNFSIFDAAELFVLLSGFLIGMVWLGVEAKEGQRAAQKRFARRAFEVWRALIIGGFLMAFLSAGLLEIDMEHTAIWHEYANWVIHNPYGYLGVLATMWLQPNLLDVLAVYVILIASAPLLVPFLVRFPLSFAAGSVALWWFAPVLNALIPNHRDGGLLFNPFGWQMLFYSGVAMGLYRDKIMPLLMPHRRLLTIMATALFLFGTAIIIGAKIGEPAIIIRRALKLVYGEIDKWPLDGTRFLAIMAATWLVAVPLAEPMQRFAASGLGRAMQTIGKGGLWSFIICVMLSVLGDAFQMNPEGQGIMRRLLVDFWAILALWWLSALWMAYGAPRQKARKAARRNMALLRKQPPGL